MLQPAFYYPPLVLSASSNPILYSPKKLPLNITLRTKYKDSWLYKHLVTENKYIEGIFCK